MKHLKEMNVRAFTNHVKAVRNKQGYSNESLFQGFQFAFHREFPETGKESFSSIHNNEPIDEELFILEVAGSGEFTLGDSVELLAKFFCGIQIFEDKKGLGKNRLQAMTLNDLRKYVTPEMVDEKARYVNQILKLNSLDF